MSPPNPQKSIPIAGPPFAPLPLSADDLLPVEIVLLLAYPYLIAPSQMRDAIAAGLRAFPHLTGRIRGTSDSPPLTIEPENGTVILESLESPTPLALDDLPALTLDQHGARFAPAAARSSSASHPAPRDAPLFEARLTRFPTSGVSVLGIMASHMAVDGTGLGLFMAHCTADLRGAAAPPVSHGRDTCSGTGVGSDDAPPHGYIERDLASMAALFAADQVAGSRPALFTVPMDAVRRKFLVDSPRRARFRLSAWLCGEIGRRHPAFSEVAVWCNGRGSLGIPAHYTGNAGCFLHLPLRGAGDEALADGLHSLVSRKGLGRIAETYLKIRQFRSRGRELWWDGPGDHLLQLNLISPPASVADFGGGPPGFALLLSRNSSGLRISTTTDGRHFLVEACLPGALGDWLIGRCQNEGLLDAVWGGTDGWRPPA